MDELLARRPASRIYHYTSQAGLIGIVGNKCIWATSIYHLNDATEFGYAREIMKRMIEERRHRGGDSHLCKELDLQLDGVGRVNLFVACFSKKKDLLSQWRAYCPNGNGYSIGFTYAQLEKQMKAQEFFLVPCIYDPKEQEELIRELVDSAFDLRYQKAKPDLEKIAFNCIEKFVTIGPALKDSTFIEEAEWRLVSKWPKLIDDPQIMVREGKSMLLPYFEFDLAVGTRSLPKPRIVVGPNPHMDLAILSVQFLLGSFAAKVEPTKVPYRGW
jgi:hypothetical protein